MIVAEGKKLAEVLAMLEPYKKILILGCGGCVTVCAAGGSKEVSLLAGTLRLARQEQGKPLEVLEETALRQCQRELLGNIINTLPVVEAVLSLGCGVGVQSVAELAAAIYPDKPILPGLNTRFMGSNLGPGVWAERCQGCGECILDRTFGICPITLCAKGLLNGPCDGAKGSSCELSPDLECAWKKIYDRAKQVNQVERLLSIVPAKDWSQGASGGLRKVVRGDVRLAENRK